MTHTYHQGLPGYHPDQLLHDGCNECEKRGKDFILWIQNVDDEHFMRALRRGIALWNNGHVEYPSHAEGRVLFIVGAFMEKLTGIVQEISLEALAKVRADALSSGSN